MGYERLVEPTWEYQLATVKALEQKLGSLERFIRDPNAPTAVDIPFASTHEEFLDVMKRSGIPRYENFDKSSKP
jgi:hypothetical protein